MDEGVSGSIVTADRSAFGKVLDRLEDGDSLVVSKLDRLGRDSMDVERTLRDLEARGVAVIVLQLGKTDLTSSSGKLIRQVLASVAEMERSMLVERTRAGMARAKAGGKVIGRPSSTTDADRASIRKAADEGVSISQLARDYQVSRSTVLAVLKAAPQAA